MPTGPAGAPLMSAGPGPTSMDYFRTITYVFENPNWLMNLLWLFLAQVVAMCIPIVPQIVVMGYQFETIDGLLQTRGTRYPDFRLDRFGEYLMRGLWPFLAMFVASLAVAAAIVLPVFLCGGCLTAAVDIGGGDTDAAGNIIAVPTLVFLGLVLPLTLLFVVTPVSLRAGLAQDFASGFDITWIKDFVGKMWMDMLLATIVIGLLAVAAELCTCFIGLLVVIPIAPLVTANLWYQFYAIYLTRGGRPVPVKIPAFVGGQPMQPPAP